jgi:hypothetical protein
VRSTYNRWAALGNTDPRFAGLLYRLGDDRKAARYLRGGSDRDRGAAAEDLALLRKMRDRVKARRPKRSFEEEDVEYTFSATREIIAGELLFEGDVEV